MTQNRAFCGDAEVIRPIRVEQGGVADAVVWIGNIIHGKAFDFPKPLLDRRMCRFFPTPC